jgi:hypothetical protein
MKEKRKYPRFDVVAKLKIKKSSGDTSQEEAFVKNISAEGFCFYSKDELKTGEQLEIDITELQIDEAPICVKGEVVWSYKNPDLEDTQYKDYFLNGVRVLGVRKTDEARFAMLYCERMLAELKSFLRL